MMNSILGLNGTRALMALALGLAGAGCSVAAGDVNEQTEPNAIESTSQALAAGYCQPVYLGGTPSASSNPGGVPQAFDGSTRSGGWQAATTGNEWYQVDLGSERRLDGFLIAWSLPSSDFDVQWKDSAGVWRTARTYTTSSSPNTIFEAVGLNIKTRYVRVYSRRSSSATSGVILSEVELSGDTSSACSTTYRIDSVHSGKSLDMTGWSTVDGGLAEQWAYGGGNNQRWEARLVSARRVAEVDIQPEYEIHNIHSGKCLDIAGPSTADGATIHQWTCLSGQASQRFYIEDKGNGQSQIRSSYSGKCLDVNAWGTQDGAKIIQWSCSGGNNQKWFFRQP